MKLTTYKNAVVAHKLVLVFSVFVGDIESSQHTLFLSKDVLVTKILIGCEAGDTESGRELEYCMSGALYIKQYGGWSNIIK